MKITREIIDNGQKIVHVNYEKKDLRELKKRYEEELAKQAAEAEGQIAPDEAEDTPTEGAE